MNNLLSEAANCVGGVSRLAEALGVSYQAIRKWERAGRLPRTEWTGETAYAEKIEALTSGRVTREQLLSMGGMRSVSTERAA